MKKYWFNIVLLIFVFSIGCATAGKKHLKNFSPSTVSSLKVGMTTYEIEKLFGPPDSQYLMTFGENTEEPWDGLVYKYYTIPDPKYQTIDARISNSFIFYAGGSAPQLNHWEINYKNMK
jgi:hypothetical protein